MSFRVRGLTPAQFAPLFGLSEADLAARGVMRMPVEETPSAPCRVTLADAAIGETVLLLSHTHQPEATPYRQQGPIFVRERDAPAFDGVDVTPPALAIRTLSLRAFDANHMMQDADLVEGAEAHGLIARFFANPAIAYIHAHYARRGCFAARIDRA
jgi:hypothetical protein